MHNLWFVVLETYNTRLYNPRDRIQGAAALSRAQLCAGIAPGARGFRQYISVNIEMGILRPHDHGDDRAAKAPTDQISHLYLPSSNEDFFFGRGGPFSGCMYISESPAAGVTSDSVSGDANGPGELAVASNGESHPQIADIGGEVMGLFARSAIL